MQILPHMPQTAVPAALIAAVVTLASPLVQAQGHLEAAYHAEFPIAAAPYQVMDLGERFWVLSWSIPMTPNKELIMPNSVCSFLGLPLQGGQCLMSRMSPDSFVISMECLDENDGVTQQLPADFVMVDGYKCDPRRDADSSRVAFQDSCFHPFITTEAATFTYRHSQAEQNQWKIPADADEPLVFSCAFYNQPTVTNPKIRFYIQHWSQGTVTADKGGESRSWIYPPAVSWGQVEIGESRTARFTHENLGFGLMTIDPNRPLAVRASKPAYASEIKATVPRLSNGQRMYSRWAHHLEPPNEIVGMGGRIDVQVEANMPSQGGDERSFAVTALRNEPLQQYPTVWVWYQPVVQYTPEIRVGNGGLYHFFGHPTTGLATREVELINRAGVDLQIYDLRLDGPEASVFEIVGVYDDDGRSLGLGAGNFSFAIRPWSTYRVKVRMTVPMPLPTAIYTEYLASLIVESDSMDNADSRGGTAAIDLEGSYVP